MTQGYKLALVGAAPRHPEGWVRSSLLRWNDETHMPLAIGLESSVQDSDRRIPAPSVSEHEPTVVCLPWEPFPTHVPEAPIGARSGVIWIDRADPLIDKANLDPTLSKWGKHVYPGNSRCLSR